MKNGYGYNNGGWGYTSDSGSFTGYGYGNNATNWGWQNNQNPLR